MSPTVAELRAAGLLSPLDEHLARTLGALAGESTPEVLLAAALLGRGFREGHTCLDLRALAGRRVEEALAAEVARPEVAGRALVFPPFERWSEALAASALVEAGPLEASARPLVLDAGGRAYLRRFREHQARLAASLLRRARQEPAGLDRALLAAGLERLFPRSEILAPGEPDWQKISALVALRRRFALITGGPGTGKTTTVAKILALVVEQALAAGRRPPRIDLLAPTGKAAARLAEAVGAASRDLGLPDALRVRVPETASTVHRRLRPRGGGTTRFRHGPEHPLPTDLVLLDEASMVDLALMDRLVAAVPEEARLLLLGDPDQLSSVAAGSVLADLTAAARGPYSPDLVREIREVAGESLPAEVAGDKVATRPLPDCAVRLRRSYRYGAEGGIAALAAAIREGRAEEVLALLASGRHPEVRLEEPVSPGRLPPALEEKIVASFRRVLERPDPAARLAALEEHRVLAAHRHGPFGVETLVGRIEEALRRAGLVPHTGEVYAGRPILITRNDYGLDLFNGDLGVVGFEGGRARVCFAQGDGARQVALARLPRHETALAISIHKSQGSEVEEVAVVLPEADSPLLGRELLYTAVTRARRRVTLHAAPEALAAAVARPVSRDSGLESLLL